MLSYKVLGPIGPTMYSRTSYNNEFHNDMHSPGWNYQSQRQNDVEPSSSNTTESRYIHHKFEKLRNVDGSIVSLPGQIK